ncbi:unnamed protein product, partial [Haemonchus placei]|uniref:Senescence domain-containing protein n=1 Tax=Haemonchus placei TaxID=6290 RepID=A0A0N4VTL0_HAEPC
GSSSISDQRYIFLGGERVAWGVETAAVKVTSYLDDKAEKYRSGLAPAEKPMTINPALKGSLVYMHKGSKLVAKCTRYLLDKIGDVGISIGKSLASGAEKTLGKGSGGGLVTGAICEFTLYSEVTVQSVKIKYGDEASEAAHHALFAAGHTSLAAAQLWDLGPRSVAGRVARRAGVQLVKDLHEVRAGEALPVKMRMKDDEKKNK